MGFTAILGFECDSYNVGTEFDITAFKRTCQSANDKHPGWNVKDNLLKYIDENKSKVAEEHDLHDDPLGVENMRKLFRILDSDNSGTLQIMEVYKLFKSANLSLNLLFKELESRGGVSELDFEAFHELILALEKQFFQKNIDGKILLFLQNAMHAGMPAMEDVDLENLQEDTGPAEHPVKRKKAVIIGINYIGTANSLEGCIYDAKSEVTMLTDNFGFPAENIRLLTDDQDDSSKIPTRQNIVDSIEWLVEGSEKGDVLFFHYSGHGSQVPDPTGQEADGKNECLCPADCMSNPWPDAVIIDDYLNDRFFDDLPEGVRLTCIYDCCHSGTMTDLPVRFSSVENFNEGYDAGSSRHMVPPDHIQVALSSQNRDWKRAKSARSIGTRAMTGPSEPKLVWTVSGCQDNQTSADACIGGNKQGALTWSLHNALQRCNYDLTYEELLHASRKVLRGKYTQIPSMSTTVEKFFGCKFLGCGLETV